MAPWVMAFVALAGHSLSSQPAARHGGRVVDTTLRLRGGQASDAPPKNALTRDEITDKMNAVPAFCIMNGNGGMVGVRGKDDGKEAINWFTDAAEAKAILAVMKEHNPGVELELGVHGLGTAFRLCKGWGDSEEVQEKMQTEGAKPFAGELRVQGNMPLMKETTPRLTELLEEAGIDKGGWQLPIFLCEELQSSSMLPVFLSPADLAATWEKSGRKKEDLPEGITMMDIRMLAAQMQTEDNPWRVIQFVGSQEAYELVREIQEAARPATKPTDDAVLDDLPVTAEDDDDVEGDELYSS